MPPKQPETMPTRGPTPAQRQASVADLARVIEVAVAAMDSGRWTAAEIVAVIERGPASSRSPG